MPGYGQSREELIRYGDHAFKNGQYASAAYFYDKLLTGQSRHVEEMIYPYQFKYSNRDFSGRRQFNQTDTSNTDSTAIELSVETFYHDTSHIDQNISEEERVLAIVRHKLAEAYRLDHNYLHAEPAYAEAIHYPTSSYPIANYYYGCMLLRNGNYVQAEDILYHFVDDSWDFSELDYMLTKAKHKITSCTFGRKYRRPIQNVIIRQADSVLRVGDSNIAPIYFGSSDKIIFSSARKTSIEPEGRHDTRDISFDLFTADKIDDKWGNVKALVGAINTGESEAAGILSDEDHAIYYTKFVDGKYAIYLSKFFQGNWLQPLKLNEIVNVEGYSSMHPAISSDGKTLYYATDRPFGKGGFDIWQASLNGWGYPIKSSNLETTINTHDDEISPFLHKTSGTLYFSSNGHVGFGGFDVFQTALIKKDNTLVWKKPINIRKPLNSAGDDVYFRLDDDAKTGFLSSDREICEDCPTGNCINLYQLGNGPVRFSVDGYVTDEETEEPIFDAKVTLIDVKDEHQDIIIYTDEFGYYSTKLDPGVTYFIKATKTRHFRSAASISTANSNVSEAFIQDFSLRRIPLESIEIPGIEYDYNSAHLRAESEDFLMILVRFLEINDQLVIEIQSHTDVRGRHIYNLELSDRRAKSVVDYLIFHEIPADRLIWRGYGEEMPAVPYASTEDDHQRNRRTAFRIISEDYEY